MALTPEKIDVDKIELLCEPKLVIEVGPDSKTQYKVTLGLSWQPPELLYGGNEYEISISDRHVDTEGIHNPFIHRVMVSAKVNM